MDVTKFGNDPFRYIDTITNSFFGFLSGFPRFFFCAHSQSLSLRFEDPTLCKSVSYQIDISRDLKINLDVLPNEFSDAHNNAEF